MNWHWCHLHEHAVWKSYMTGLSEVITSKLLISICVKWVEYHLIKNADWSVIQVCCVTINECVKFIIINWMKGKVSRSGHRYDEHYFPYSPHSVLLFFFSQSVLDVSWFVGIEKKKKFGLNTNISWAGGLGLDGQPSLIG